MPLVKPFFRVLGERTEEAFVVAPSLPVSEDPHEDVQPAANHGLSALALE